MRIYEAKDEEELLDVMTKSLEEKTKSKIFTLRILGDLEDGIETIVVFENKKVLLGMIKVTKYKGQIACRIQGDFI